MNTSLFAKDNAVVPDSSIDLRDKEGYLVKNNAGAVALNDSKVVPAVAVVLDGQDAGKDSSLGVLGAMPPVRLKAGGAIAKYQQLEQKNDGTVVADEGPGTARVIVGVALEAAEAGDLFLAQTFPPVIAA